MSTLQPNTLLQGGKYKIINVLGQGGFGITYLAEQVMLGRKVAVKEFFLSSHCRRDGRGNSVSAATEGNRETVERYKAKFVKEARLIATMDHRNIIQIHDIFAENGTAYYVMEYIDGMSLEDKAKGRLVPEPEALKYIRELAEALRYIHERNILHLDVKPANVLLRKNGETVLIDFGISKRYDKEGGQTSTTPVGISKGYAPMEQYDQGLTTFSPATDIYSLGATLYRILSGTVPPDASSLLNEIAELTRPDGVSDTTWTAIKRAMEPKFRLRPQTIDNFLTLLNEGDSNENTIVVHVDEVANSENAKQSIVTKGFNVNGISFKMVLVKAGTFTMGATSEQQEPWDDEKPAHRVTLTNDYYIGQTEVTQELWQAVMGSNPSRFKGSKRPVECVSWNDCQKFIKKLNSLTGKSFRLPTEAEWELAARGGNKSKGYQYSGSNNIDDVAWYSVNCYDKGSSSPDYGTHNVATKQPNELGIYDMSGNVWEWCQDWYGSYSSSAQTNPTGANSGSYRVFRGGSWDSFARYCRSANRCDDAPDGSSSYLGLRLALSEL